VEVLSSRSFGTEEGDLGASITSRLGFADPDRLVGMQLNLLRLRRDTSAPTHPSDDERTDLEDLH
jgi:hypothetical protein